ncbi:signal peptide peptidase SppA [Sphingomonas sp.]|uniref:signal peptide peptidase SppA n=1 Tax=Sphingomonas sp. TaxID=28214 RepID=UPI0025EEF89D|nr:signal peptide peptidase SppA [Sphingomonas sp.]
MKLVRGAWKLLVGVKDALVLLFMLLFFGLIYAALSVRPNIAAVGSGALVLQLKGSIVEQPENVGATSLFGGRAAPRQFRLRDLVRAIDVAATDDRIKAVVLDLDGFTGGGRVALTDVGEALDRVRAAKKPVLAFATGYQDSGYMLAAHASQIWLDPMGLALFTGPGGSQLYYKGLIDKLGVNAHVYRVGKYKSFVEPYIRADQSPEAKAENEALINILWQGWQANVQRARPKARIAAYASDPVTATASGDLAQSALTAGIVDRLGDRASFTRAVAAIVGPGKDKLDFARVELPAWIAAHPAKSGDGRIAVVTVAGNIVDGQASAGTAGGDTIAKLIKKAIATGKYKAFVLRVDSPGGSAMAGERIRAALEQARAQGIPIVASMGNVAASGGYWVTTVADRVFAEPMTITGSIGVFGIIPTFEGVLPKVGLTTDGVASTPLSGQPDVLGGTSAAFDTIIQRSIESTYGRFIALVSGARKLSPARVNEIAQGRVWDGGTARQINLVDAFGGIDDAIAEAARRAKLDPAADHAVWLEKPPTFTETLAAAYNDSGDNDDDSKANDLLSVMARQRIDALTGAIADAQALAMGASVQTRCLECSVTASPTRQTRLIDLIMTWITK